jgi:hypothetical protein
MKPKKPPSSGDKGKGRGGQSDAPSPTAGNPNVQGRAAEAPANTPSSQVSAKARPKRKTAAQKRQEQEEAEAAFYGNDEDPIFEDYERANAENRMEHILTLPPWQETDDLATTPGVGTSGAKLPPKSGISPQKLLKPPTREDVSSSASSRASKRRRETSPTQPPRRPPYRPGETTYRDVARRSPPQSRQERRRPPTPVDDSLVSELQARLRHAEEEIQVLRRYSAQDYEVGYQRGRADGFEHALGLPAHKTPAPMAWVTEPPRDHAHSRTREQEVHDVRRATVESRRTYEYESRGPSSSGAGPSRSREATHRTPMGSTRQRPASPRPLPPKKEANEPSKPGTREVTVTCKDKFFMWPDPASLKHEGAACLPVPMDMRTVKPIEATQTFRVPHPAPAPDAASSYLELWAGFIAGRSIPDGFERLFQAYGTGSNEHYVRSAMIGYGLSRRIAAACPTLNRNFITAFLVVLATCDQYRPFFPHFWPSVLARTEGRTNDNWAAARTYRHTGPTCPDKTRRFTPGLRHHLMSCQDRCLYCVPQTRGKS